MYTAKFWGDTLERSVVTFLQFAIVLIPANFYDIVNIEWGKVFTFCLIGMALSIGKAMLAGLSNSTASLVDNEPKDLGAHHINRPIDRHGE